ncbi:MAG: TrmB family transcriptional regulator [Asgard group archaeon]|nr:TrmB family transcriptional regulator [Asgard group archaeon]
MSLERVIKALIGLGLSRVEAEVYVFLAKNGPLGVETLEKFLNYNKNKIIFSLKTLALKNLVCSEAREYVALPFEEALELLIMQEKEKAKVLQENRESLIDTWRNNS